MVAPAPFKIANILFLVPLLISGLESASVLHVCAERLGVSGPAAGAGGTADRVLAFQGFLTHRRAGGGVRAGRGQIAHRCDPSLPHNESFLQLSGKLTKR